MSRLIFFLLVGFIVVVVFATIGKRRWKVDTKNSEDQYIIGSGLLSQAERSFFGVMDQAIGADYRLFAKVRVADVVAVRKGLDGSNRQKAFNRIAAKHFDFVVCRSGDLSVACAVELDDRTHRRKSRAARDEFLSGVCASISLPLLREEARFAYAAADLRERFLSAVGGDDGQRVKLVGQSSS